MNCPIMESLHRHLDSEFADDKYQEYIDEIADKALDDLMNFDDVSVIITDKHDTRDVSESIEVDHVIDDVLSEPNVNNIIVDILKGESSAIDDLKELYKKCAGESVDLFIRGGR